MIFYKFITFLYCKLISFYEKLFLKKNIHSKDSLNIDGYQKFQCEHNLIDQLELNETVKVNNYLEKLVLKELYIFSIIEKIFIENNLSNKISQITGYNYSIDFLTAYRTYSILEKERGGNFYANKWHIDKPFSSNNLKVIVPIKPISVEGGGIKILSKENTKKINNLRDVNDFYTMESNLNEILVFNPNQCYHKAGNPKNDQIREQIIIQLNPANNWNINLNIFQKQYHREPKFPIFSYFFDKRKIIC